MPLLLAVAALSAAAIGYEILLTRLFSIVYWHHYAYMIISLALLGYGASGTFIALFRDRLLPRAEYWFVGLAAGFGLAAPAAFALAQRVPFNPLELLWDPAQPALLFAIYLLLAIPFFCAASCIGLALAQRGRIVGRVYRADLAGAAAGATAILAALFLVPPEDGLRLVAALGFAAAALAARGTGARAPVLRAALLAGGVAAAFAWPAEALRPHPSPYKGLSLALEAPGARVVAERSSPLGLLSVVESPAIPFRHAPGIGLLAPAEPPPQLGVFFDAGDMTAINRWSGRREDLGWLDQRTAALPFHLLERPRVLVLGAGGGGEVLLGLYHEARSVDAVELNPQLAALVRDEYAAFAGRPFAQPSVRLHVAEARSFVAAGTQDWDLIQVSLLDAFSASAAGAMALSESTLYTVEAMRAYLQGLAPGGVLSITRWLRVPPRDGLKLAVTAAVALERAGIAEPGRRLAMIRGPTTTTLLVRNGPFGETDIAALTAFSRDRGFDVVWYPGMPRGEANRINRLPEPYFHDGVRALLGSERATFLARYKFHVAPATDDRPYFFRFFKWRLLPEVLAMRGRVGLPLLEGGYLLLVATLLQAMLAAFALVLAPLRRLPPAGSQAATHPARRWRVAGYFAALGLAFLFIEIAFIQRFVLFLGHPLYAIAVVLAAFLLFAGLGSGYAARVETGAASGRFPAPTVGRAVAGIAVLAACYLLLLPEAFAWLAPLPQPARIVIAVLFIAPLAFCMGMPFPLGLAAVRKAAPGLVPWAWAINGCASVTSAVLAALLAMHLGFAAVIAAAVALYIAAAAALRI